MAGLVKTGGLALIAMAAMLASAAAAEGPGSGGGGDDSAARAAETADRAAQDAARAADRAAQDLGRATERAVQDTAKVQADVARDQQRYDEERAKILADATNDPVKAQQDLLKLDADRQKWEQQRTEEFAKIQADLTEEEAKIAYDSVREASEVRDEGSSEQLRDLAQTENPDRDERGFPIRRGVVEALDLSDRGFSEAKARGFGLIERIPLEQLGRSIVRLSVPAGVSPGQAVRYLRTVDPKAAVDFTHYYGMQPAGEQFEAAPPSIALPRRAGKLRVGMIDTKVSQHLSVQSLKLSVRSFGEGSARASVDHGTAVASILASEGTRELLAADVFRADATGRPYTSADAIAASLDWLAREKVPVVNISLAGPRNAILDTMILRTLRRGTSVVAAAGNGGPSAPPAYPAALRPVVAVTAVDDGLRVYRYANRGDYITVAAPGVREPAARAGGGLGLFSGTSFAAPHVAAWLARCIGPRQSGLKRVADCRARMIAQTQDLGAPGFDDIYGYGLVR